MSELTRTVLYVHSSNEMYGADITLLQLVERLDPQRWRPIVVLPTDMAFDGKLEAALTERGITALPTNLAVLRRAYFHPLRFPLYLWRFVCSVVWLLALMRRERVAVVHSNTLAVIPGAIAARLLGIPHAWHIHEIITRPKFLWRLTAFLAATLSTVNVVVSEPTRAHLVAGNGGNAAKTRIIDIGLDMRRFDEGRGQGAQLRREWHVGPDEVLVGMIGRFSHWKGQDHLLEVARRVLAQATPPSSPSIRFAFVGGTVSGQEAVLDNFVQAVAAAGLQDRVTISGYRTDIAAVLEAFDIFVLPSTLPDPMPSVVLEAMAMARPVVANAHGGSTVMVAHGETGLLVDPGSPEMMAAALRLLIDQPAVRRWMGDNGRRRFASRFSLDRSVREWTALYDELLAGAARPVQEPAGGLKIALLGTRGIPASYSGFETCVEQLGQRLVARGHQVTVYCRSHHITYSEPTYKGMRLVKLPTITNKYLDTLVHSFLSSLHVLPQRPAIALYFIAGNSPVTWLLRPFGAKTLLNVDGLDWKREKWPALAKQYIQFAEYLATKLPTAYLTDSRVVQQYYRDTYGSTPPYIPYGSDVAILPPGETLAQWGLAAGRYVLFVGRLVPENCAHHLVEAFRGLATDMKCVIVGDAAYAEEYKAQLRAAAGGDPRVVFTGYVFGKGYHELGSNAAIFVESSGVGGTHPALVEAMAHGSCTVVNDTPENLETIGDAGFSYSGAAGAGALRDVLQRLLDDAALRQAYAAKARARANTVYTWEAVTDEYERLFYAVLKRPLPARLQPGG